MRHKPSDMFCPLKWRLPLISGWIYGVERIVPKTEFKFVGTGKSCGSDVLKLFYLIFVLAFKLKKPKRSVYGML